MARDTMRQEKLLIVVRVTSRQLQKFPARGWVAVEVFSDETSARARFHALRLPLEELKVGAVLVHALTTPDFEYIEYQKTVISKDADFWELQSADIIRASEDQQSEWNECIAATLKRIEEKRVALDAAAALRKAGKPIEERKSRQRSKAFAACAGFVLVAGIGVAVGLSGNKPPAPDWALQQARRGIVTVIMADKNDPNMLIEFELKDDGSRRLVRRISQSEAKALARQQDVETTQAHDQGQQSLTDALNRFFAVRN